MIPEEKVQPVNQTTESRWRLLEYCLRADACAYKTYGIMILDVMASQKRCLKACIPIGAYLPIGWIAWQKIHERSWKLSRRQAITRVPDKVKMVKFRCGFWSDLCEKSCTSILLQVPPAKSAMEEPQATAEAIAGVLRRCLCHCRRTPLNLYPPHETSQSSMIGKDLESWAWSFSV